MVEHIDDGDAKRDTLRHRSDRARTGPDIASDSYSKHCKKHRSRVKETRQGCEPSTGVSGARRRDHAATYCENECIGERNNSPHSHRTDFEIQQVADLRHVGSSCNTNTSMIALNSKSRGCGPCTEGSAAAHMAIQVPGTKNETESQPTTGNRKIQAILYGSVPYNSYIRKPNYVSADTTSGLLTRSLTITGHPRENISCAENVSPEGYEEEEVPPYHATLHKYLDLVSFDPRIVPCVRINTRLVKNEHKLKKVLKNLASYNLLPPSIDLWGIFHVDDRFFEAMIPDLLMHASDAEQATTRNVSTSAIDLEYDQIQFAIGLSLSEQS